MAETVAAASRMESARKEFFMDGLVFSMRPVQVGFKKAVVFACAKDARSNG
jgi:hypothetical protein